jgi:hydrogenase expression/formation protein HypE
MAMSFDYDSLSCPIPKSEYPHVLLAHGGGGRLMHQLIDKIFAQAFASAELEINHDGATFKTDQNKLVFTTDSYVVNPIFFPGGDIGSLAVYGTVNDLAMCGGRPLYLSAGFILEEGLLIEDLWKVAVSMRKAADNANVRIVTGDTKVVEKGKCDRLYINTAGVGVIEHNLTINPSSVRPGDKIILSGDIGRHGIAIMAEREGLSFETQIESDCAPLAGPVMKLIEQGVEIHCLRDLTRGGLATSLVEIAQSSGMSIEIEESAIPVREDVRGVCELLGFDPLYVANEGRFVAFVPVAQADRALEIMRSVPVVNNARIIGEVIQADSALVILKSRIGTERIIDMLSGEQLPRIC